jgi:hypothetical protein
MSLGVTVRTRTAPPSRGAPTDTGTAFVVGQALSGPLDAPTECRSIADFIGAYGDRVTGNAPLYDWVDTFLREGGSRVFVGRYTTVGTVDSGLALFTKGLGPGQIAATDETPGAATYGKLLDHAEQNNRYALLDVANADTVAAMETLGTAYKGIANSDYGLLVGPWVNVPSPAGVLGGGPRAVHGSAVVAALCARADALGNPNRAAAGRDFPLQYVTGFVLTVSDVDREALLDQYAVNTFADVYGVLELYGFQTGRDQDPDDPYWQANCGRARMWLVARAAAAGEKYAFRTIDGRGRLAGALKGEIDGICLALYGVDGLFGTTPAEAFATTVGASVNTIDTTAQGELDAVVEARLSIDLVSVPVSGAVSAA